MMRRRLAAIALVAALGATGAMADTEYDILDWGDLDGWSEDDHQDAMNVFLTTCRDIGDPTWSSICALAGKYEGDARTFFETFFRPVLMTDGSETLITGYYEPELEGSRERTDAYAYPIYRMPTEVPRDRPWFTRAEIETGRMLADRSLEIAWLADPVEAYFLQVQGSGRIRLTDGSAIRVGFGGANGQPYVSVGEEMVRRGILGADAVSAQAIGDWVRANPSQGRKILQQNPRYVFFREVSEVPPDKGPLGAMDRSVAPLRSVAVDTDLVPLGAPVWVEKDGADPMNRLMIAQDTGAAIKGAQRVDIFYGTGAEAGARAGRVRDAGRIVTLLPIPIAFQLAPEG